jgi:phage host-nuclease inhibitor protein Gam
MEEPKVTLDDLARMMASGFSEVRDEFKDLRTEMDARFAAVDTRFAAVDKRFDTLDKRLSEKIDRVQENLDQHRQETKDGSSGLHRIIGGIVTTLADHEERIRALDGE